MDCHELIDLQTAEEQETVRRVLRKLHNERHGEYHPVFAGLREMAGHERLLQRNAIGGGSVYL